MLEGGISSSEDALTWIPKRTRATGSEKSLSSLESNPMGINEVIRDIGIYDKGLEDPYHRLRSKGSRSGEKGFSSLAHQTS